MSGADSHACLYARTTDIITTEVAGEIVLLDSKQWSYFEFDLISASIWALLDQPRSLPSLVEALTAEYDVDAARCLADTKTFLDDMISEGLIAVVDRQGSIGIDKDR